MSNLRFTSCLLAAAFVLTLAGQTFAQKRADNGLYVAGRVGLAVYGGDRDNNGGEEIWSPGLGDKFEEGSWGFGAEIGTILSRSFTLSLGYQIGNFSEIANDDIVGRPEPRIVDPVGPEDFPFLSPNSSTTRHTIPLMLKWIIVPKWTISPFVGAGANLSFGSYTLRDETSHSKMAYGPSFTFGLDWAISSHSSIFLDIMNNLTFDDFAIDAAGLDIEANQYAYDVLSYYSLGLKYTFKPACNPPDITSVDVPERIAIGAATPLSVGVVDGACEPVEVSWDLGGGAMAAGLGASHMFSTPGTYDIQVTTKNSAGSDSRTIAVEVYDPCPIAAEIIAINTSPGDPIINETISFTADVRGTVPVTYAWDFGDGTTASGARAAHMYSEPGEYTVTLSCSNCGGTDTRTLNLRVTEFRCADITELNSVFFGRNSSTIDEDAMALLDENVEVLNECPDLLARLDGYSDRGERNSMRLSETRAQAVEQFYIEKGISANRLMARGLGRDPLAGKGVDGMRNRRVDSIIVDSFE